MVALSLTYGKMRGLNDFTALNDGSFFDEKLFVN